MSELFLPLYNPHLVERFYVNDQDDVVDLISMHSLERFGFSINSGGIAKMAGKSLWKAATSSEYRGALQPYLANTIDVHFNPEGFQEVVNGITNDTLYIPFVGKAALDFLNLASANIYLPLQQQKLIS